MGATCSMIVGTRILVLSECNHKRKSVFVVPVGPGRT